MIVDWIESNIDDNLKYTGTGKEVHFNCVVCGEIRHRMYVNLETGKVFLVIKQLMYQKLTV